MRVAVGSFTDKAAPPTEEAMRALLGPSAGLWREATLLLERRFGARGELRFYGRSYGWALRYRRKGRALASLYPAEKRFTVQVVVPASVEKALAERLRPSTRALLEGATAYREGRWLFLPVTGHEDLAELEGLLAAKVAARRRPDSSPQPPEAA